MTGGGDYYSSVRSGGGDYYSSASSGGGDYNSWGCVSQCYRHALKSDDMVE